MPIHGHGTLIFRVTICICGPPSGGMGWHQETDKV
jgi:hypothetical protein